MKYTATIELKDDTRCDGCLFVTEYGSEGQRFCKLGEFFMATERSENVGANGLFQWHTPRPRGCPLKPIDNGRQETVAECLRRLREIEAMNPKKDKPMYEVEK